MYRNPHKEGDRRRRQEYYGMQRNPNVLVRIHKLNFESPRTMRFFNVMVFVLTHVYLYLMQASV